jgi:predicted ATPase
MALRSGDVPQAPRLDRVRRVVESARGGGTTSERAAARAQMKPRDAAYHLSAATTTLGLLAKDGRKYRLTSLGERLLETERASEEERAVWIEAVRQSAVVRALADDLLGNKPPDATRIAKRIEHTGLSPSTAAQRASALVTWREQLEQPRLSYGAGAAPVRAGALREESAVYSPPLRPTAEKPVLSSLRLEDFKSFANETVPLARLTVFVGANGSGKSNVLDAIRFLQGVALDLTIADVLRGRVEGGREIWPPIRGGVAETCRYGRTQMEIGSTWTIEGQSITHRIQCGVKPVPLVHAESLIAAGHGSYLFDTHAGTLGQSTGLQEGRALNVALRGTGGGRNPTQLHSADSSLLGQLEPGKRVDDSVLRWASALRATMRATKFMSISSSAMRSYAPAAALELGADGQNISAIVKQLCVDPAGKRQLVEWVSELCAPRVKDIDFVETELGDVMLQFVEADGAKVSARSLSDGTLRFLGHLVALLSAPPGSVLLMEEVENGLHPQRLHLLVELLEGVTRERGVQVIATSHSPLVLTALSQEALAACVVFARVEGREGTVARRLGDLPGFSEVATRRGADRVFASGWLERAL